jgi:hypothetical protein
VTGWDREGRDDHQHNLRPVVITDDLLWKSDSIVDNELSTPESRHGIPKTDTVDYRCSKAVEGRDTEG